MNDRIKDFHVMFVYAYNWRSCQHELFNVTMDNSYYNKWLRFKDDYNSAISNEEVDLFEVKGVKNNWTYEFIFKRIFDHIPTKREKAEVAIFDLEKHLEEITNEIGGLINQKLIVKKRIYETKKFLENK